MAGQRMFRLRIQVDGELAYSRGFLAYAQEIQDMSSPLTRVGEDLLSSIGRQFATEGAYAGTPWMQLSRSYGLWKEEHYPGRPILVRTGEMRRVMLSFLESVRVGKQRLIYEPPAVPYEENPEITIADVAAWHQHGRGRGPARPMLILTPQFRRDIDRTIASWLIAVRRRTIGLRAP